ncbi:SH3 domain-containing protein [Streptomyces sp. NPDC058655]|uniref:SH3 domain-containing protein n=1 Tax=unclassified Streptomyces TaxID=2593676 RepID=UPI003654BBBD
MLKPTRTILALATGSLVLGLVGAGAAVADGTPMADAPSRTVIDHEPALGQPHTLADRYAVGRVISKGPLKIRSKPTTQSRIIGQIQPNRKVEIECKKYGESVDGNRLWYRLNERNGGAENGNGGQDGREEDREEGRQDGSEEDREEGRDESRDESREEGRQDDGRGNGEELRVASSARWVSARYVRNLSPVQFCR